MFTLEPYLTADQAGAPRDASVNRSFVIRKLHPLIGNIPEIRSVADFFKPVR